jgi:hypothetical protein
LTNILLHVLVSLSVLNLFQILLDPWASLAGSLIFAVHPVHEKSVAFVSGRTDLFAVLFSVLAPSDQGAREGLILSCLMIGQKDAAMDHLKHLKQEDRQAIETLVTLATE